MADVFTPLLWRYVARWSVGSALPSPSTSVDVVADFQQLPGIGPYTTAAVASIAHEVPAAVVDGNVRRVVARQTATLQPRPTTSRPGSGVDGRRSCANVAPSVWNQAVMELGAPCARLERQVVRIAHAEGCLARDHPTDHRFSSPAKRRVMTERLVALVDVDAQGHPHLVQRSSEARFGGLWGPRYLDVNDAAVVDECGRRTKAGDVVHLLSHRRLEVEVWVGQTEHGVDPASKAISTLDERVLELAIST